MSVESVHDRVVRVAMRGAHTERVAFFSDAVFGIAMTLLAVEIAVPAAGTPVGPALLELAPEFGCYALSFAVIGVYWMTHHRYFQLLRGYTTGLLRLNLLMLLLLALVPFATSLLGRHPDDGVAVVAYAALIASVGGVQVWLWEYSWHHGLFSDELDAGVLALLRTRSLVVPVVFVLSIPVALTVSPLAGQLTWLLVLIVDVVLHLHSRRHRESS